ncbi:MAG: vWA domain-containing protein [bacterium]
MSLGELLDAISSGSLQFHWPWAWAALLLPLLSMLLPRMGTGSETSLRVPFFQALTAQGAGRVRDLKKKQYWMLLLAIPAWVLLVAAAARPQWVGEPLNLPVSGRDLMLAVDLSGSMQEEDMRIGNRQVDRLTAVKAVAGEFIKHREGDRLGLILFADRAYLQAPLTFDHKTVNTLLQEAVLGLAGEKTAIGDAIGLAVKRLRNSAEDNRVLILLTDGANTAGSLDPLKAAELAAREHIRIYTIGVGADSRRVQDPYFGISRLAGNDLDEDTLKAIAATTHGRYFRARDIRSLQKIYALLDEIEPVSKEDAATFRPVDELFTLPLQGALALASLLGGLLLLPGLKDSLRRVNGGH